MPFKDKEKQKLSARKHYEANKAKMIAKALANNKKANKRNKDYVNDYLSTHPCVDCGNNNVIVLEFDHVRGEKRMDIARMKQSAYSLSTIKEEINKCDVRCANCHRIATHNRRL